MRSRWTKNEAWEWYSKKEWIMGVNYVPSVTLHCAELWQDDTREEVLISVRKEISLMREIGINCVRMFLPFNVWYCNKEQFFNMFDELLQLFFKNGISFLPVIFNDCVGFGKPEDITPRVSKGWKCYDIGHHGGHKENPFTGDTERKGWIYWDEAEWRPVMEEYLRDIIKKFRADYRILAWDLWNEPGNSNRYAMSIPYLKRTFEIAREESPIQPLTAGVWRYPEEYGINDSVDVDEIQRLALNESDIVTFHQYEKIERVKNVINKLTAEERPMMNTEWLNRVLDNFIADNLPLYHENKIGSFSWGLVAGKSQFFLPWDELWKNKNLPLNRWQHDLFDTFYTAYDKSEIELMRCLKRKADVK